jgi:hypothetical protein
MKLKVGDIELDSESGVTFDGRQATEGHSNMVVTGRGTTAVVVARATPTEMPKKPAVSPASIDSILPDWQPSTFLKVSIGVAMTTAAAAAAIVPAYLRGEPLGMLIFSLVPFTMLSVTNVFAAVYVRRRGPRQPVGNSCVAEDAKRVAAILRGSDASMCVETIANQLSLPDTAVAAAIIVMVRNGLVDEDVDVETGAWSYRFNPEREVGRLEESNSGRRAIDVLDGKKPSVD